MMNNQLKSKSIVEKSDKLHDENLEDKLLLSRLEEDNILKGKCFDIKKEDEEGITLESSEEIELRLENSNGGLYLQLNSLADAKQIELSITGIKEAAHKFEDSYSNYEKLTPNEDGKIVFKQDMSKDHILFIQATPITYILTEDGWSPECIGTWNPDTRQATLTQEGNATIDIQTDNVILNGLQRNGEKYSLNGQVNSLVNGIFINGRKEIVICNFEIYNCDTAIRILNSKDIVIKDNSLHNNTSNAIYIENCTKVKVVENTLNNNYNGVYIYRNNKNITVSKNNINNTRYPIYVVNLNDGLTITCNNITKTDNTNSIIGIYASSMNSCIKIEDNNVTINNNISSSSSTSFYGIYCYNNDKVSVQNNSVSIFSNTIQGTGSYAYNYFYGIVLTSYVAQKTEVRNNIVRIENNAISIRNGYQYVVIYGMYHSNSYNGELESTNNKVRIRNNNISAYNDSYNSIDCYIRGAYLYQWYCENKFMDNSFDISNNFINANNSYINGYIYGVYMSYIWEATISNNCIIIKNNRFGSGNIYGIYDDYYSGNNWINGNEVVINDNTATNFYNIFFNQYIIKNIIRNNKLSTDKGSGIYFNYYDGENIIAMNEICCNGDYGIFFNNLNRTNEIKNNLIKGSHQYGIVLNSSNLRNQFKFNNIIENNIGLLIYAGNDSNCFESNNFINPIGNNSFNYGNDNKFNGNYFDDWNGKIPYDVNGTVDYNPQRRPIAECQLINEK